MANLFGNGVPPKAPGGHNRPCFSGEQGALPFILRRVPVRTTGRGGTERCTTSVAELRLLSITTRRSEESALSGMSRYTDSTRITNSVAWWNDVVDEKPCAERESSRENGWWRTSTEIATKTRSRRYSLNGISELMSPSPIHYSIRSLNWSVASVVSTPAQQFADSKHNNQAFCWAGSASH